MSRIGALVQAMARYAWAGNGSARIRANDVDIYRALMGASLNDGPADRSNALPVELNAEGG